MSEREDDTPTSFDALAHEHNLSARARDLCRIFWLAALRKGEQRGRLLEKAAQRPQERRRGYHPVLDKDTVPGEFR